LRYLHVLPRYYPFIGGSEVYIQQIVERLVEREPGAEVSIYTTDAWDLEHFWSSGKRTIGRPSHEVINGVEVERFKVRRVPVISPLFFPVWRRLLTMLSASPLPFGVAVPLLQQACRMTPLIPSLGHALRQANYDLVHAVNAPFDSIIYDSWQNVKRTGAAFVFTPHVHLGEPKNPQVRKYYTMRHQMYWMNQADAVITMTFLERDYVVSLGVPGEKVHIVGPGIEPTTIIGGNGQAFRQKHSIETPIVFYQGTAAFDKGTVHLVQAMQLLWKEKKTEATLVIAGPVMSHFQKFYDVLPTEDKARTKVLGFISPEEKRDLFAAGDVFAMPSRTDSFGIVYLEAWLNGKPVVGAAAGGVPGLVSHQQDGLLEEFGDIPAIANSILTLLEDTGLAAKLAAAGRKKTLEHYTADIVYSKVKAIYDRALEAK
jgi:glycosyltransferase involved in cell wall biosynthesis